MTSSTRHLSAVKELLELAGLNPGQDEIELLAQGYEGARRAVDSLYAVTFGSELIPAIFAPTQLSLLS